jgi:hypothetical protein
MKSRIQIVAVISCATLITVRATATELRGDFECCGNLRLKTRVFGISVHETVPLTHNLKFTSDGHFAMSDPAGTQIIRGKYKPKKLAPVVDDETPPGTVSVVGPSVNLSETLTLKRNRADVLAGASSVCSIYWASPAQYGAIPKSMRWSGTHWYGRGPARALFR